MLSYERKIHFYETDLMGIVHHSNYVRICEEARVHWAQSKGLITEENPEEANQLAVLGFEIKYLQPLKFPQLCKVKVQAKFEKAKLIFEYKIFSNEQFKVLNSEARSFHVAIDDRLKPQRPSDKLKKIMKDELWTETWLLNL